MEKALAYMIDLVDQGYDYSVAQGMTADKFKVSYVELGNAYDATYNY